MNKKITLTLFFVLIFFTSFTISKAQVITDPGLQTTTLEKLIQNARTIQDNSSDYFWRIQTELEKIFSINSIMPDPDIDKLVGLLTSPEEKSPLSFLAKIYGMETTLSEGQASQLLEYMEAQAGLRPSVKLVNRDKFILSFLRKSLPTNDFSSLVSSGSLGTFLSSHINRTTFPHYAFVSTFVPQEQILDDLFSDAIRNSPLDFKTNEVKILFRKLLTFWTTAESSSPVTDRQLDNILSWYRAFSSDSKTPLMDLDLVNRVYEKQYNEFEDLKAPFRVKVINQQIFLNLTANIGTVPSDTEKLSFHTILTIVKNTHTPSLLPLLKSKMEDLVDTMTQSDEDDDQYRASLAELEYAKVELLYIDKNNYKGQLALLEQLKEKWLNAYQAFTGDVRRSTWPPTRTDELFEEEKPLEVAGGLMIDLTHKATNLNQRVLSPAVFTSDRDVFIKAENLYFHPLTLILTQGKNIQIQAKSVYAPTIDTSGGNAGPKWPNYAEYTSRQLPQQLQWGGDPSEVFSLKTYDQIERENAGYYEGGIFERERREYNFSIIPDNIDFRFLDDPVLDLDGISAQASGNITIIAQEVVTPFLMAIGGNGSDGKNGCDSKIFPDGSYQKMFRRGIVAAVSLVGYYRKNNGDGWDEVVDSLGACREEKDYSTQSVSLHRVEAGSGGNAGDGGNITLQSSKMPASSAILNFGGVPGKKGEDAKGPAQENRRPKDGKDGKTGSVSFKDSNP